MSVERDGSIRGNRPFCLNVIVGRPKLLYVPTAHSHTRICLESVSGDDSIKYLIAISCTLLFHTFPELCLHRLVSLLLLWVSVASYFRSPWFDRYSSLYAVVPNCIGFRRLELGWHAPRYTSYVPIALAC